MQIDFKNIAINLLEFLKLLKDFLCIYINGFNANLPKKLQSSNIDLLIGVGEK